MEQNYPLVSINLLSWNGQKYIQGCLESVFKQTHPNLEVLIIDNASTDGTVDYLKKLPQRPNLKIIYNQKNVGFSGGHNQAIKKSNGDFILCLNQDVILDKNFIKEAVKLFNNDEKIAAVQGKLLQWQKEYIDTTGLVILKNRRIIARGQGSIDNRQFEKIEEIFGPDGAVPIYRKKALEDTKIKGEYFDEDFLNYKEDVDLAWRLRLYGWKSFYQPKAIAYHDRTSGDSAAINYFDIIRERLKLNKFNKYLAFKNQRLMQIKNERVGLLLQHLPWFLPKEIGAWVFAAMFEKYTWKAFKDLFKQAPLAWQKRKIIMKNRKVGLKEMSKWFK